MRKVALILHGFPGLSGSDPIRKYLVSRDLDAVIPDLFNPKFKFDLKDLERYVETLLNGRKPDVILAASLGGLIAPFFALKYPKARLVLIATGPRIQMGIGVYDRLIKNGNPRIIRGLTRVAQKVPAKVYNTFYRVFNPYRKLSGPRKQYDDNLRETFINFRNFPFSKSNEVVEFVKNTDNTNLLKLLKNKTLIFTGGKDVLMPQKLSHELKTLINNSTLIENPERLHYQVFDERDFDKIDEFLK